MVDWANSTKCEPDDPNFKVLLFTKVILIITYNNQKIPNK